MTTSLLSPLNQKLVWLPVEALNLPDRKARKHAQKQHEKACSFVRKTRYIPAIVTNDTGVIIHGYEFYSAAVELGWTKVPVIKLSELSPSMQNMIQVGYYKILDLGEFDMPVLQSIFQDLTIETGFDFHDIGFELTEADSILGYTLHSADVAEIIDPIDEKRPIVSTLGDEWMLGKHILYHGNSLEAQSYQSVMKEDIARAVVSDPPYNQKRRDIGGKGKVNHGDFVQASGELLSNEFIEFLKTFLSHCCNHLIDGGLIYSAMDWRHAFEILTAARVLDLEQKNCLVWNKTNAGMGSHYRSKHEFFYLFKSGSSPHVNTVELGAHGRYRSNVLDYAGVNTFRKGRMKDLIAHPTVKPTALIADLILDCSKPNDIILDPFAGSGTIFLACERIGRRARAIELDGVYVDTCIRRWQAETGDDAIHKITGETFEEREMALSSKPRPRARNRTHSKGGLNVER